jgi:phenylpropionate dioxygenase-like ring-hydroxylating dioxygenase large terminal subunit
MAAEQEVNGRSYDRSLPELGLREYWYPACTATEIGRRPLGKKLLGSPVVLVRFKDRIYALADECPHRGTRLSLGTCEFPGTDTISCIYHGWTFDVTNGNCVAALADGPDSPVVGKVRVRTYPTFECQGIVWIWMGETPPVPPQEDIPLGLQSAAIVKVVRREVYGNWRWHIENPSFGHAPRLHRNSLFVRFKRFPAFVKDITPQLEVQGEDGKWLCECIGEASLDAEYPGLGRWPRPRLGEGILREGMTPILGVRSKVSVRLPAVTRVIHHPFLGVMYYEWYVQTDANHYVYFQVCCSYARNALERAWFLLRYHVWGRQVGLIWFNNQDLAMVADSQDYVSRHGAWNAPTPLFRPDRFQLAWRDYALACARIG